MKYDRDKVAGVMLGMAAGDALGAGYEFRTPPAPGTAGMIGGGLGGFEPGEWTDDTQMAVCVLEGLRRSRWLPWRRHIDPARVAGGFIRWYQSRPADIGNQTRAVLRRAEHPADVSEQAARYFKAQPDNSAGNGSLMRTAPVALAYLGDDQAIAAAAREISSLTHADPLAGDACVLWCIAIDRAVRENHTEGIHDGLAHIPDQRRKSWERYIRQASQRAPGDFGHGNGYVVTALQAAYSAVCYAERVMEGSAGPALELGLQVAVAIGGDTDTVAAIAGALLGARYGASAVPDDWRKLIHGWPGLDADGLARLALAAAR